MAGETVLDLFVSSPGDVQRERERIDFVVERLNAEYAGRVRIRTIRWETRFYSSHETFQSQIPEAADCDLVVAVFGARLGSPLPETFPAMATGERYPSGSAYEVLSAIEARRRGHGVPDVFVFRRPDAPLVALDAADRAEIEAQWRRLTDFFETWFRARSGEFLAAFQEFRSTDEFAAKVEGCLRQWLARRGFPPLAARWDRRRQGSPYPGLAAFDAGRRAVFFGRDAVIEQALARLREVEAPGRDGGRVPFLLLIGASGSGKSSLLAAGLLPRIGQPGVLPEVDLWRRAVVVPGPDPFASLAEALLDDAALGPELQATPFHAAGLLAKQLAGDPDTAVVPLGAALAAAAEARRAANGYESPRPARLFLAIDQAERLLIETPPEVQTRFSTLIATLCRRRLATVAVVLRSDAYARFQALDAFVALRAEGATLDLLPATTAELEEMAARPAAACEPPLAFERRDGRSLAAVLVADARGGDALPLLQMTLARLAAAEATRGDGVLRFDDYHGLGEAVSRTAGEALDDLDAAARAELANLIAGLVRDQIRDPATGRAVPVIAALDRARFEAGRPERRALIESFVAHRLLTAEGDAASRRVRPTHESLLRIWPEAVAILEETAHLIRARAAIEPLARDWAEADPQDRARHLEVSPALLESALAFVRRFGEEAAPTTVDFVREAAAVAEARHDRERAEQERRIADAEAIARANRRIARSTGAGLAAALLLAALAGWQWHLSVVARGEAQVQRDRAERALAAATATADGLVFDLAQKLRNASGIPKPVVKDILDRARRLQEQLIGFGESSLELTADHAAALGESAATELSLGETAEAARLALAARDLYAGLAKTAPGEIRHVYDLAHTEALLGDVHGRQGRTSEARAAYERAEAVVEAGIGRGLADPRLPQLLASILQTRGAAARAGGDPAGALALYRRSLALTTDLTRTRPDDMALRHNLAVVHRSIGDVELETNALEAADADFTAASEIAARLAREFPENTLLQRDYTLSQERLGLALTRRGDHAGALKAFVAGEATALAMAATDPANLEWQYDVAIGHLEIGDARRALGDVAAAIASYREAARIDAALVAKDPTNADWRRHHDDVGQRLADALEKTGEASGAAAAWRDAIAFARSAIAADPSGTDWRRRAIRAEGRLGALATATDATDEALTTFRVALAEARALPPDREARQLLLGTLIQTAGALALAGDDAAAVAHFAEGEALGRALIAEDAADTASRGELALLLVAAAPLEARLGRATDAAAKLRDAIGLCETLAAATPGETKWRREAATAWDRLGDVLQGAGDVDGAVAAYRRSLAIVDTLPAAARDEAGTRRATATTQEALAGLLDGAGRRDEVLAAAGAAVDIRRRLAEAVPDDRANRRAELADENLVGRLLATAGKPSEALARYRAGLAIARDVGAGPEADAAARHDLAISLLLVGLQSNQTRDFATAAAVLGEAVPVVAGLRTERPSDAGFARLSGLVGRSLSTARLALGDRPGALAAAVAARDGDAAAATLAPLRPAEVDPAALDRVALGLVAEAMVNAGEAAQALAALDAAGPSAVDATGLDLVRVEALAILGRSEAARALVLRHRGETAASGRSWEAEVRAALARLRARGASPLPAAEIERLFAPAR